MRRPEYQRIRISLKRLNRILVMVENSWLHASRLHARKELENLLDRQHELEKESEDVRWDIESSKIRPVII